MSLHQVAELAQHRFIGDRFAAQIDADEGAQRPGIMERFFGAGIRQVEPMLEEVDPQHPLDAHGPAAGTLWVGIERFNGSGQLLPRNDAFHLVERLFLAGLLAE